MRAVGGHATCVLWSGGKDCFAALLADAIGRGRSLGDAVLVTCAAPGAIFRCHPLGIVERQVVALRASHLVAEIDLGDWEESYRELFRRLRDERGVARVVTGDVYREDWLVRAVEGAGLELVLPLREFEDPAAVLDLLDAHQVSAIVSGVRSIHLRPGFLGRPVGRSLLASTGLDDVEGFHPLGENGEFHTIVTAFGAMRFYDGDPSCLDRYERDGIWSLDWSPEWLRPRAPAGQA